MKPTGALDYNTSKENFKTDRRCKQKIWKYDHHGNAQRGDQKHGRSCHQTS